MMSFLKSILLASLILLGGVGVFASKSVEGWLYTNARTGGKTAWYANGVGGWVGCSSGTATGGGLTVSGDYGNWDVNGTTQCAGTDSQVRDNYLMVQALWESGDATSKNVGGTVTCSSAYWQEDAVDGDCNPGPPSWNPVGQVTTGMPGQGNTGGSGNADVLTHTYGYTSPGVHVSGFPTAPAPASMAIVPWTIDPLDSSTWSFRISVKITARLDGGGAEVVVATTLLTETVSLTMTL